MRLAVLVATIIAGAASPASAVDCEGVALTSEEIGRALLHGPWPPETEPDPSNRVSGAPEAIALGRALFEDPILSRDGAMSCASCHDPDRSFTDARPRAVGRRELDRNTPALWNLRFQRWYGWAGGADNLWAQSLLPVLAEDELAQRPEDLKAALIGSAYAARYAALFGDAAAHDATLVAVNLAKALAAYQETLITGPTAFDRFRTALVREDCEEASRYPLAAQRGLALFVGEGACSVCHSGPMFSNGEFHDAGVPYFVGPNRVDGGRHAGLKALLASPFTLDGAHSDDARKSGAWAVRQVRPSHSDFGTFRTPSLRGVALTPPYMHAGSLADLEAVIRHYSEIDLDRLHADGEAILRPLNLNDSQIRDLVAFLESLGGE